VLNNLREIAEQGLCLDAGDRFVSWLPLYHDMGLVGFMLLPVLHRVLGLDMVRANMHKVFIIGSYTIVALIIFMTQVEILWLLGICLALGNSLGAWLGAHMSIRRGETLIRVVLNTVLVLFIIKLLFFP